MINFLSPVISKWRALATFCSKHSPKITVLAIVIQEVSTVCCHVLCHVLLLYIAGKTTNFYSNCITHTQMMVKDDGKNVAHANKVTL